MKPLDDIQRAHDTLTAILLGEVAIQDLGALGNLALTSALDALCWVLQHDHNQTFANNLAELEQRIRAAGYVVTALDQPVAPIEFGPCCACGGDVIANNIICLEQKSPIPGSGWGCVACGLSSDGAIAVVCDACIWVARPPRFAVVGQANSRERIPIGDLIGEHKHDTSRHPEIDPQ